MYHKDRRALQAEWLLLMGLQESSTIIDLNLDTTMTKLSREFHFRSYRFGKTVIKFSKTYV